MNHSSGSSSEERQANKKLTDSEQQSRERLLDALEQSLAAWREKTDAAFPRFIFEFPRKEEVKKAKDRGGFNNESYVRITSFSPDTKPSVFSRHKRESFWLGDLEGARGFTPFLKKFGYGFLDRLDASFCCITRLQMRMYRMKYKHLEIAYSFYKKSPAEFTEAVKTARTLKDFIALAGIHMGGTP